MLNFDTSNVENMESMFLQLLHVKSLDVSKFNTKKVKSMKYMFLMCQDL